MLAQRATDRWVADIDCVVQSLPKIAHNSLPRKWLIIPSPGSLAPSRTPAPVRLISAPLTTFLRGARISGDWLNDCLGPNMIQLGWSTWASRVHNTGTGHGVSFAVDPFEMDLGVRLESMFWMCPHEDSLWEYCMVVFGQFICMIKVI